MDVLVDGLLALKVGGLDIRTVKFSGFIGEPLINKATLPAMVRLKERGRRVGLFTNGVLLNSDTWWTVAQIDYVHVSLDAGPSSFFWLKEDVREHPYTTDTFYTVVDNIRGLSQRRHGQSELKINVGYVVVPGNHAQIYDTVKIVKEAGADSIRFQRSAQKLRISVGDGR